MLAAVSEATSAAKDSGGHMQRLEATYGILTQSAQEVLDDLLRFYAKIEGDDRMAIEGEMQNACTNLLRRAKQAATDMSVEDATAARKQLREKDLWWKLKLETNRVATKRQLQNQAARLEEQHEQQIRARLLAMKGDEGTALDEALTKLEESEKVLSRLRDGNTALLQELEAVKKALAAQAAKAQREMAQVQQETAQLQKQLEVSKVEQQKTVDQIAALKGEIEHRQAEVARLVRKLEDLAVVEAERDALQQQLSNMADALAAAEQGRADAIAEGDRLRIDLADARVDADASRATAEMLDAKVSELTSELTKAHDALVVERGAANAAKEAFASAEAKSAKLEAEVELREHALKVHKEESARKLDEASAERDALAADLSEAQGAATQATAEAAARFASEKEELVRRTDRLERANAELEEKLTTVEGEVGQLRKEAAQAGNLQREAEQLRQEAEQLRQEAEQLRKHASLKNEKTERNEPASLPLDTGAVDKVQKALQEALSSVDFYMTKNMSLEQQILEVAAMCKSAVEEKEGAIRQLEKMSETLQMVTAASKAERERLIAYSLDSLRNLRTHLLKTLKPQSEDDSEADMLTCLRPVEQRQRKANHVPRRAKVSVQSSLQPPGAAELHSSASLPNLSKQGGALRSQIRDATLPPMGMERIATLRAESRMRPSRTQAHTVQEMTIEQLPVPPPTSNASAAHHREVPRTHATPEASKRLARDAIRTVCHGDPHAHAIKVRALYAGMLSPKGGERSRISPAYIGGS